MSDKSTVKLIDLGGVVMKLKTGCDTYPPQKRWYALQFLQESTNDEGYGYQPPQEVWISGKLELLDIRNAIDRFFELYEKEQEPNADIISRLRWDTRYTHGHVPVTMEDAAKEIERLRRKVNEP